MGTSEISDGFSDWEEIRDPYDQEPVSSEYKLVLRENYCSDGSPVFPPTEHEGLPIEEDSLSVRSLPDVGSETDSSNVSVIVRDVRDGISKVKGRMLQVFATKFRLMRQGSIVVPGALLAVALFACLKFLQWKNRLLHLLREKDQRISQLLSQIAHMNEILSARRKVPILRIN